LTNINITSDAEKEEDVHQYQREAINYVYEELGKIADRIYGSIINEKMLNSYAQQIKWLLASVYQNMGVEIEYSDNFKNYQPYGRTASQVRHVSNFKHSLGH
jgi:hypothetical protein